MKFIASAALAAILAGPLQAATVIYEQRQVLVQDGQDFVFRFVDLARPTGGGDLTLSSGRALGERGVPGLDLGQGEAERAEWFDLFIDDASVGRFACHASSGATPIPGNDGHPHHCQFSFALTLDQTALDAIAATRTLDVTVDMSEGVNAFRDRDELVALLSYEAKAPVRVQVAETPIPASAMLLGGALFGLGALRRRSRRWPAPTA